MKTYTIGRRHDGDIDIKIDVAQDTVSKLHARITPCDGGRYLLEDMGSTNGTFVLAGGEWSIINSHEVRADERVRLGHFTTTIQELLTGLPDGLLISNSVSNHHSGGTDKRPRRDPETGEIIYD